MVPLRDQWRSLLQILFRIGLTKPGDIIIFFVRIALKMMLPLTNAYYMIMFSFLELIYYI